jgi:hypothetical protein
MNQRFSQGAIEGYKGSADAGAIHSGYFRCFGTFGQEITEIQNVLRFLLS